MVVEVAIGSAAAISKDAMSYGHCTDFLKIVLQCIRFPVVAVGVIRWVECEVSDPKFFSLSSGKNQNSGEKNTTI